MNDSAVRQIAQSNPVPNLTQQYGELASKVRATVDALTYALREMDKLAEKLAEHDLTVTADLGQIGNAAAAARRDLERQRDETPFRMPTNG